MGELDPPFGVPGAHGLDQGRGGLWGAPEPMRSLATKFSSRTRDAAEQAPPLSRFAFEGSRIAIIPAAVVAAPTSPCEPGRKACQPLPSRQEQVPGQRPRRYLMALSLPHVCPIRKSPSFIGPAAPPRRSLSPSKRRGTRLCRSTRAVPQHVRVPLRASPKDFWPM